MKSIYDLDLEGLEKRKRLWRKIQFLYVCMGTFFVSYGLSYYYVTKVIGISIILVIFGMSDLFLAVSHSDIGLLIYLKKKGM